MLRSLLFSCIKSPIFQQVAYKRIYKPPLADRKFNHRQKKIKSVINAKNLTPENYDFLKDVVEDRQKELLASPLKEAPWPVQPWKPRTRRTGVLAVKIGVIPQWDKSGKKFLTTLLQIIDNHVIDYLPPERFEKIVNFKRRWKDKYGCCIVGALSSNPLLYTPQYLEFFQKTGLAPKKKLTRFIVSTNASVQPGTPLDVSHFRVGDYVDCQAKTIGHGFQGVVKRWGFKGGPKSHGTTKWHRRPGSIGFGRNKGRVHKGKKMPGKMGFRLRSLCGLKIWRINTQYNVLYVHGGNIPGPNLCYVRVFDSLLPKGYEHRELNPPPIPTADKEEYTKSAVETELVDENLFTFTSESISYQVEDSKATAKKR